MYFGVGPAKFLVPAFANDRSLIIDNDGADRRVGFYKSQAAACQLKSAAHHLFVEGLVHGRVTFTPGLELVVPQDLSNSDLAANRPTTVRNHVLAVPEYCQEHFA